MRALSDGDDLSGDHLELLNGLMNQHELDIRNCNLEGGNSVIDVLHLAFIGLDDAADKSGGEFLVELGAVRAEESLEVFIDEISKLGGIEKEIFEVTSFEVFFNHKGLDIDSFKELDAFVFLEAVNERNGGEGRHKLESLGHGKGEEKGDNDLCSHGLLVIEAVENKSNLNYPPLENIRK